MTRDARIAALLRELADAFEAEEQQEQRRPAIRQQPRRKRKLRAEDYELARKVMGGVKEG